MVTFVRCNKTCFNHTTRLIICCPYQATKSAVSSNNPKSSSIVIFVLIIVIRHNFQNTSQKLPMTEITTLESGDAIDKI